MMSAEAVWQRQIRCSTLVRLFFQLGKYSEGLQILNQALVILQQTGFGPGLVEGLLARARVYLDMKEYKAAQDTTHTAYIETVQRKLNWFRIDAMILRGQIQSITGQVEGAICSWEKAAEEAAQIQAVWLEVRTLNHLFDPQEIASQSVSLIKHRLSNILDGITLQGRDPRVIDSLQAFLGKFPFGQPVENTSL